MRKNARSTFNTFVQSLLGRPVSYVSLFANSLRMCVDRQLKEKAGFNRRAPDPVTRFLAGGRSVDRFFVGRGFSRDIKLAPE